MTSVEPGPIRRLDHITLAVEALDAATARYEILLAQPCARRGSAAGLDWALFALANTALILVSPHGTPGALGDTLARRPAGEAAAIGALAFAAEDPGSAARLLERRGLPTAGPPLPWLGGFALALDPSAARGLRLLVMGPGSTADPASPTRLDHLVIRSGDPERTLALLSGRLGLELRRDRSNPAWGTRLLFFRCGDLVLEVSHDLAGGITDAPDSPWGVAWRVPDVEASHARLEAAGMPVSPLRTGRKPGTRIFTVRDHAAGIPTALIGA